MTETEDWKVVGHAKGLLRFLREHNSDAKFWEERWREAADQREQMQVERDAARAEVAALRALVAEGIEAFRLTKEYVNIPDENEFVLLPDVEGWSHWDWTVKALALIDKEADRG